ncbi:Zinc ion binding, partial [Halocaridina rubra]
ILEEIEALQAIMPDEVTVLLGESGVPKGVEVTVVPATAQNVEEQHVRVTLVLSLPSDYPDVPPSTTLRNPRGVDDYVLTKIERESKMKCEEYLGCPVIYELIEVVRENLTANNAPSCPCAICLYHFTDNDVFTKTLCFHYFHSYCLGRYIASCELEAAAEEEEQQPAWMAKEKKPILCPVCRDPIQKELSSEELLMCLPPEEDSSVPNFSPDDPDVIVLRQRMTRLYLQQKEKGGIIDLEEEKNKFLLSSNSAEPYDGFEEGINGETVVTKSLDSPPEPGREDVPTSPPNYRRGGRGGRPMHQRPPTQKMFHGSLNRHHLRNNDQSGDVRFWMGNRGGRGSGNSRGRSSGGRGGHQGNFRYISESHEYPYEHKASHYIDGGYGGKGRYRREGENDYYSYGENRSGGGMEMYNSMGGMNRRGAKNSGNRQRYDRPARGRGRGPPSGYAPSTYRNSSQDWS